MKVETIHPGVDIETVVKSTGFELIIPDDLKETRPASTREIKLLREKVDPLGVRKLEVLSGTERKDLLNEIISKELSMEKRFPQLLSNL